MNTIKKENNTSIRLKEYMNKNNMKQVDILNKAEPYCKQYNVKLTKQDLSQYVSGKTEPNQDKLAILSMALNVDITWLMGFDVPMNKNDLHIIIEQLSEFDKERLKAYIKKISLNSKTEYKQLNTYDREE